MGHSQSCIFGPVQDQGRIAPPSPPARLGVPSGESRFSRIRIRTWAIGAVVLALMSVACDLHNRGPLQGRASDEWTRSYTLQEGGEFQIVGASGSIEVTAGQGPTIDVRAERIVRAATDAAAEPMVAKVRIAEDVTPERVVLRTEGLGGGIIIGLEIEVNYHVTVPSQTHLRLRNANGSITVSDVGGPVVAATTNGNITGKNLSGGVDARSTNGGVSVDLLTVTNAPVDLRAVNGGVDLTLPATADANIAANCTNGTIDTEGVSIELTGEQTRRRMRGRMNQGGAPIELTTTNGNIHIRTPESPPVGQ